MDTPPLTTTTPNTPSNAALDPMDEKLLKRARNAARNLFVLASLASLGAIILISVAVFAKGLHEFMAILAVTISLIAVGYWLLAVAANRGNPNAVGIVIVAMVLQICLALIFSGITAAQTNTPFQPPVGSLFIPILVLVALANSRKVLLELKQRQLWQQVFGAAKPSGKLCVIGGTLLVMGFVSMNAGTSYLSWKVTQQRKVEIQHANAFVELVQVDEKDLLSAVKVVYRDQNEGDIETALSKLSALEQHLGTLTTETPSTEQLHEILLKYDSALRQWKNGLLLLKDPKGDRDRAQKMFTLGDRFRAEACQEYDQRYAAKKPQSAN